MISMRPTISRFVVAAAVAVVIAENSETGVAWAEGREAAQFQESAEAGTGTRWRLMSAGQREAGIEAILRAETRLNERLSRISEGFLGTPYRFSPLGEGAGATVDSDPLMSFVEADCLTFVEQAVAFAVSDKYGEAQSHLNRMRYVDGVPKYEWRNHFMTAQWLPNNERAGYFRDITGEVGGAHTVTMREDLTAPKWRQRRRDFAVALAESDVPFGNYERQMIPLAKVADVMEKIPDWSVVWFIRSELRQIPSRFAHLGFVYRRDGQLWMRHAAKSVHHRVVDVPFPRYLASMRRQTKWPVEGIALMEVSRPAGPGRVALE